MLSPVHVFLILFWILDGGIGYLIGNRKGRPVLGTVLGFILGAIGWIIMAFIHPTHDELVRREREKISVKEEAQWEETNWLP